MATKAALFTRTWLLSAHLPRGCWKASTSSTHSLQLPSTPALVASYRSQGTAWAEARSASPLCCPTVSQINLQTAPASKVAMARGGLLPDADFQESLTLSACSSLKPTASHHKCLLSWGFGKKVGIRHKLSPQRRCFQTTSMCSGSHLRALCSKILLIALA